MSTEAEGSGCARADELLAQARALTELAREFLDAYRQEHVRDFIDQVADEQSGYADRVADELAGAADRLADEWADERSEDPGTIR